MRLQTAIRTRMPCCSCAHGCAKDPLLDLPREEAFARALACGLLAGQLFAVLILGLRQFAQLRTRLLHTIALGLAFVCFAATVGYLWPSAWPRTVGPERPGPDAENEKGGDRPNKAKETAPKEDQKKTR